VARDARNAVSSCWSSEGGANGQPRAERQSREEEAQEGQAEGRARGLVIRDIEVGWQGEVSAAGRNSPAGRDGGTALRWAIAEVSSAH